MRMDGLREWIQERGMVLLSVGIVLIAVGVVVWVAWPQIKPRPKPQAQSLSTVVTTGASQPVPATNAAVPEDVAAQIAEDLGIDDMSTAVIRWEDDKHKVILVREQEDALEWKEHRFVERDGRWVRK